MFSLPLVDLRDASGPGRDRFVRTLGQGLDRYGFVAVAGHGVPPELLTRAYTLAAELFALPLAVKQRHETPGDGRQRGYTSFGVEHAKDSEHPDLKEFWHVGRTLAADHPLHTSGDVPRNQFPPELPAFQPTFTELFGRLEGFAGQLLDGVGAYLGLPDGYFGRLTADGNSVLRLIHYPDVGPGLPAGAVRAAAHEDINLLTVLPVSTRPGLEILTREGEWIAVSVPPDVMVCDTGDMMALLTGGRMPATTHRVVNPEGGGDGGRLSMPFFLHPHPDALLTPHAWPGAVPDPTRAVRTRDFFHARLRDIGVE